MVMLMPNWCENKISFQTNNNDLIKYFESLNSSEDPKLFSDFIPEPDYHNEEDGYDWRGAAWGTKWQPANIGVTIQEPDADGFAWIEAYFDTPYAPPIPFVLEFEKQTSIPVMCHFMERDMGFCGIYRNGLVESYHFDAERAPKEIYDAFEIDPEPYWIDRDEAFISFGEPKKGKPWRNAVYLDRRRREIEKGPSLVKRFATYIRSNFLSI